MQFIEIKNLLLNIADPVERLEFVMDLGKQLSPVPDNAECHDIKGCASRAQICNVGNNFFGSADSALVRGVVAIIISMVDGQNPDAIRGMDLRREFSDLNLNLGAGRMNGVDSMIHHIYAKTIYMG